MILKTIDEAESFVNSNESFSWDGWNIVKLIQDDYAEYLSIGSFNKNNGKWYRKIVFECSDYGWQIPDSEL